MKNNLKVIYLLPILIILCIVSMGIVNAVSAEQDSTIVTGKVYNSSGNSVPDSNVSVNCNGNILNSVALSVYDGTYIVKFDLSQCTKNNTVVVFASKGTMSGVAKPVTVTICTDSSCEINSYIAIANPVIKQTSTNPNSTSPTSNVNNYYYSNGNYYLCGNGKCDSGESELTCPRECKKTEPIKPITYTANNSETTGTNTTKIETLTEILPQTNSSGIFSGVAGAVIRTLGTAGTIGVGIFIVLILIIFISVKIIRHN